MQPRQFDSTLTGDPAAAADPRGSGRVASIALLVRNFRVAALVVTCLGALVLSHGYRWLADKQLVENGATANETMAAAILDAMRVGEGTAATSPAAGALLRLQQEPAGGRFHTAVIDLLRGTVVRRVQVLTLGGIVAYSTEPTRRGVDESADATLQRASQGEPGSTLSQDREFVGWDGMAFKGNILSTFVPVRDGRSTTFERLPARGTELRARVGGLTHLQ